jgi:vitamin B12/bleomycin/antimicrobial peptide transport system ATP-binding/permease protein
VHQAATQDRFEVQHGGDNLSVQGFHLSLPSSRTLLGNVDLEIAAGEAVLVKGPSGAGKSTMLRAIAGIWPYGSGRVSLGHGGVFFVSQRSYMPSGTLREAASYPGPPIENDLEIMLALQPVNLGYLIGALDQNDRWDQRLSGGEQQRLAFARVLLTKPQTIFLDEATSALDEENELAMYQLLRDARWNPTIISIGHRNTLEYYHDAIYNIINGRMTTATTAIQRAKPTAVLV